MSEPERFGVIAKRLLEGLHMSGIKPVETHVQAVVKLLIVETGLVFADERDYQQAIALGVAAVQAGRTLAAADLAVEATRLETHCRNNARDLEPIAVLGFDAQVRQLRQAASIAQYGPKEADDGRS